MAWVRHPLAFLVEAADDICYMVGDAEDGLKMKLMAQEDLFSILRAIAVERFSESDLSRGLSQILDPLEQLGYLRAKAINSLISQAADAFTEHVNDIMAAKFDTPLLDQVPSRTSGALSELSDLTREKIYSEAHVVQIEAAGYEVLPGLLHTFITAVLEEAGTKSAQKLAQLIPAEYRASGAHAQLGVSETYEKIMNVAEFVCGMTDRYAIGLYRTLKGTALPGYG
jgi:dGTPase